MSLATVVTWTLGADLASAHLADHPLEGRKVDIRTNRGPDKARFAFQVNKQFAFDVNAHDPRTEGFSLLVAGEGSFAGKTELITLDTSKWRVIGTETKLRGFKYEDDAATRGGVRRVTLKDGQIKIDARGPDWSWDVGGPQVAVNVYVWIEDELFCTRFGGTQQKNEAGRFKAKLAPSPGDCQESICGDREVQAGEECDDGNLVDDDGCNSDCTAAACVGPSFTSTYDGIQQVIFDSPLYGCNNVLCHSSTSSQGSLDLTAGNSHAGLVGVPSSVLSSVDGVEPGEPALSVLYDKLKSAIDLTSPEFGGTSMPSGGPPALSEQHLEAIKLWIRGGAPEDRVVGGTAALLEGCMGQPDPLIVPEFDPPGTGIGMQLRQTARPLAPQLEDEICMATYYDLTATALVPESAKLPCPPAFLSVNNPSGECFMYHRQILVMDPQSHHSIVHIYTGEFDPNDSSWGGWTYRFADANNPLQGLPCNPADVDPNSGRNEGCSGSIQPTAACIGYGPPDYTLGPGFGSGAGTAPSVAGAQEPYTEQEFADGVFGILPMQGIVVWNSHAFNLTQFGSTLNQYLNMYFADPSDQLFPAVPIFDSDSIFVANVPPFETREYCRTFTFPEGARLFELNSHMHSWGILFRIWEPPNTVCVPGQPACVPGNPANTIYSSTEYTDPLQLFFDPPRAAETGTEAQRSYLYCVLYDNGSTPTSPPVKLQSTSPPSPVGGIGGPCPNGTVVCLDGPKKGQLCNGSDSFCDSEPGVGDGDCDACPVPGGFTTGDEMMILLGTYFVP